MRDFIDCHGDAVIGTISTFDRLIFKGHLTRLFPDGALKCYLFQHGVLLRDAAPFLTAESTRLKDHVAAMAAWLGRPVIYLASAHTHGRGCSKEELARTIAERDGIGEGLVCVFSTLEPCTSFAVIGNPDSLRLQAVRRRRTCLHLYVYLINPEFGWMYVRIQTWAPYQIQVYVNGRESLARQLQRRAAAARRSLRVTTRSLGSASLRQWRSCANGSLTATGHASCNAKPPALFPAPRHRRGRLWQLLVRYQPVRVRHQHPVPQPLGA
jgi:hypothetical protein